MLARCLYTGLDADRFCYEGLVDLVPFIKIEPRLLQEVTASFQQMEDDVILTSRTAAELFLLYAKQLGLSYQKKHYFVVGPATAEVLYKHHLNQVSVAKKYQAEGICELLSPPISTKIFYPHAQGARSVITNYLQQHHIPYVSCILYTTYPKAPNPLPDLYLYTHVMFTSPSTVRAFLDSYQSIPQHLRFKTIGSVTHDVLIKELAYKGRAAQIDD